MKVNVTDPAGQVREHLATLQCLDRLPPLVLLRECAESRRLLVRLLDDTTPALSAEQRTALGEALADALAYREPSGDCMDCDRHPAGLCEPHAADLDRADRYQAAAREAGIEASS